MTGCFYACAFIELYLCTSFLLQTNNQCECLLDTDILLGSKVHRIRHQHQQQQKIAKKPPITTQVKATSSPKPSTRGQAAVRQTQKPAVGKISQLISKIGCIRRELAPSSSCRNCLQPLISCTQDCARVQLFDCLKCIRNVLKVRKQCSQYFLYAIDIIEYCWRIERH